MSAQLETEPTLQRSSNRVFISYSIQDAGQWVEAYLLRLFEAAEVDYAYDKKDIHGGDVIIDTIKKHISDCRYTILVMTQPWVDRKWPWQELQEVLAVEEAVKEYKIIPLMLRKCTVPAAIESRKYHNLCNVLEWDNELKKVLKKIGVSDDAIEKALNSVAKKTVHWLLELMDMPHVAENVLKSEEALLETQNRNKIATVCKQLHDDLHVLQSLIDLLWSNFAVTRTNWPEWEQIAGQVDFIKLRAKILHDGAARYSEHPLDLGFLEGYHDFSELLSSIIQVQDIETLYVELRHFRPTLSRDLFTLDNSMQHWRREGFSSLVKALALIYEDITATELVYDDEAAAVLGNFRAGIDQLGELDSSVQSYMKDHHMLQMLDWEMTARSSDEAITSRDIEKRIKWIIDRTSELKLTEKYAYARSTLDSLQQRLQDTTCVRDDLYESLVLSDFRKFHRQIRATFMVVDSKLRSWLEKECSDLPAQAQSVLRKMSKKVNSASYS